MPGSERRASQDLPRKAPRLRTGRDGQPCWPATQSAASYAAHRQPAAATGVFITYACADRRVLARSRSDRRWRRWNSPTRTHLSRLGPLMATTHRYRVGRHDANRGTQAGNGASDDRVPLSRSGITKSPTTWWWAGRCRSRTRSARSSTRRWRRAGSRSGRSSTSTAGRQPGQGRALGCRRSSSTRSTQSPTGAASCIGSCTPRRGRPSRLCWLAGTRGVRVRRLDSPLLDVYHQYEWDRVQATCFIECAVSAKNTRRLHFRFSAAATFGAPARPDPTESATPAGQNAQRRLMPARSTRPSIRQHPSPLDLLGEPTDPEYEALSPAGQARGPRQPSRPRRQKGGRPGAVAWQDVPSRLEQRPEGNA